MDGFDVSGLNSFAQGLMNDVKETYPKETMKFIRKETKKLAEVAEEIARTELKEDTGNYLKGFAVGKSGLKYKYSLKAYNNSPHGHLIEDGYNQVARGEGKKKGSGRRVGNKSTGKFIEGKKIFLKAQVKYKAQFEKNAENFIDDMLYKSVCDKHIAQMSEKLGVSEDEIKKAIK